MRAPQIKQQVSGLISKASSELNAVRLRHHAATKRLKGLEVELGQAYEAIIAVQFKQNLAAYGQEAVDLSEELTAKKVELVKTESAFKITIDDQVEQLYQFEEALRHENDRVSLLLSSDKVWHAMREASLRSARQLEVNRGRHETILEEVTGKLDEYHSSQSFMYLYNAGHGTSIYKKRGVIKRLDDIVARRTQYQDMSANYVLLQQLVETTKCDYDFVEVEATKASTNLHEYEESAYLTAEAKTISTKIETLRCEHDVACNKLQRVRAELKHLNAGSDTDSVHIKNVIIARRLKSASLSNLTKLVQDTVSTSDDEQLRIIGSLTDKMYSAERELSDCDKELEVAERRSRRATELESVVRRSHYSSSDYKYRNGGDLDSLFLGYLAGSINESNLTNSLSRAVTYDPPHRSSNSSSFGDSSFSSSSSFGGGSFSTSDSF